MSEKDSLQTFAAANGLDGISRLLPFKEAIHGLKEIRSKMPGWCWDGPQDYVLDYLYSALDQLEGAVVSLVTGHPHSAEVASRSAYEISVNAEYMLVGDTELLIQLHQEDSIVKAKEAALKWYDQAVADPETGKHHLNEIELMLRQAGDALCVLHGLQAEAEPGHLFAKKVRYRVSLQTIESQADATLKELVEHCKKERESLNRAKKMNKARGKREWPKISDRFNATGRVIEHKSIYHSFSSIVHGDAELANERMLGRNLVSRGVRDPAWFEQFLSHHHDTQAAFAHLQLLRVLSNFATTVQKFADKFSVKSLNLKEAIDMITEAKNSVAEQMKNLRNTLVVKMPPSET